jgi:PncC family amidohydrolase
MSLAAVARRVARLLVETGHRIVLAESCTGGLVSAALAQVPGISEHHCGGVVTYRNGTKTAYLEISPRLLKNPGPVSERVTQLMAQRVLAGTPEATIAAAITGHLGPTAPVGLDGVIFVALEMCDGARRSSPYHTSTVGQLQLPQDSRVARQRLAAEALLRLVADHLEEPSDVTAAGYW